MRLEIRLLQATKDAKLTKFITEVNRLCEGKKTFNFACQGSKFGIKLYLYTCKGLQEETYVYVKQKKTLNEIIATLNYAVMLHASMQLSILDGVLCFDLIKDDNSNVTLEKIATFMKSLGLKCF